MRENDMLLTKEKPKKLIRFILLFFPILMGAMGTITLVVLITWLIPPKDLLSQLPAIILIAIVIYVPCIISLLVRYSFFKKEEGS